MQRLAPFLAALVIVLAALAACPTPAHAQGSALEYLNSADTRRAVTPKEDAARMVGRGERYLHKAEELAAKAAAAPADAKLAKKVRDAYERAQRELEKATAKDGELLDAHLLLARIYGALGQGERAISACRAAWALDPAKGESGLCEIRAHLALDRVRPAQEAWLTLQQHAPDSAARGLDLLRSWAEAHATDPQAAALREWVDSKQ